MNWIKCTIEEALQHASGRTIVKNSHDYTFTPDIDADVVCFSDGTAVACLSQWSGSYGSDTPDMSPESPLWWIYK